MRPVADADRAKVLFRVANGEGGEDVETLWALRVGEDRYVLENSPFYAFGVSWLDTVFAPFNESEGFPTFHAVVEKSGHRTIRVIFDQPIESGSESAQILDELFQRRCSFEKATARYVCVTVPPDIDFLTIAGYLQGQGVSFEFADPTYEELFPDGPSADA